MAFGIGINTEGTNAGEVRGRLVEIACECWFTSQGSTKPLMIKFREETGEIRTVREIQTHYCEEKNYSGIPSLEYDCTVCLDGRTYPVRLIFFKEDCRWVMRIPENGK